jgi:hypothetical protein
VSLLLAVCFALVVDEPVRPFFVLAKHLKNLFFQVHLVVRRFNQLLHLSLQFAQVHHQLLQKGLELMQCIFALLPRERVVKGFQVLF